MITFKQFLGESPLNDTAIQMALRKELDFDQKMATYTLKWLRGKSIPDSVEPEVFNAVLGRLEDEEEAGPSDPDSSDDWCRKKMRRLLKRDYDLSLFEERNALVKK